MNISVIALSHVGEREISGNKGFENPEFEKEMRSVGFYTTAPWCGFFAILVWHQAKQDTSILSASSKLLIDKATKAKNWHAEPKEGAVVVWAMFKNGKRQKQGHIGIVTDVNGSKYQTVEGNTTDKGGREGICVAIRNREMRPEIWKTQNGLRLMGFVYPNE